MPYYTLNYVTASDYLKRRSDFRNDHLALVKAYVNSGHLMLAGALGGDQGGALLVFKAEDESVVRAFAERDPYVLNGLVTAWSIKPWAIVAGYLHP